MRLLLAIAVSAAAQVLLYTRFATASALALGYIVLATLGAGWFAGRRGALAGAASVVVAAAVYSAAVFNGPAGIGMAPGDLVGNVLGVVMTFWPYIAIGAIAGAIGSALRGGVLASRR